MKKRLKDQGNIFDQHTKRYEEWFEKNKFVFESELRAVRAQLPVDAKGVEIGVGSAQFAAPLGINLGIDPSSKMRALAKQKGVNAIEGVAENLPWNDSEFDFVLMTTAICFVDDLEKSLSEAYRVLKPRGVLVIAFVDKNSPGGMKYQEHKQESVFYSEATFYTVDELVPKLVDAGFVDFSFTQTIFRELEEIKELEPVREGYGDGLFVVIRAVRQ